VERRKERRKEGSREVAGGGREEGKKKEIPVSFSALPGGQALCLSLFCILTASFSARFSILKLKGLVEWLM
jgi:hypothetical protein